MNELERAYNNYIQAAIRIIQGEISAKPMLASLGPPIDFIVNQAEEHPTFKELVRETYRVSSGKEITRELALSKNSLIGSHVSTYFKRSRFYLKIYNFQPVEELGFSQYLDELQKKTTITYLAPIELVDFNFTRMQFQEFELRKYSSEELRDLFDAEIRETFFPWANLDYRFFSNYMYAVIKDTSDRLPLGHLSFEPLSDEVKLRFSNFPKKVERVILQLTMYQWGDCKLDYFNIPFVYQFNDDYFRRPNPFPHISRLSTEPFLTQKRERNWVKFH